MTRWVTRRWNCFHLRLSRAGEKYQGWKLNCVCRPEGVGARAGGGGEVPAAYKIVFMECREKHPWPTCRRDWTPPVCCRSLDTKGCSRGCCDQGHWAPKERGQQATVTRTSQGQAQIWTHSLICETPLWQAPKREGGERLVSGAWPTTAAAPSPRPAWRNSPPSLCTLGPTRPLRFAVTFSYGTLIGLPSREIQDGGREGPTLRTWESASLRPVVRTTEAVLLDQLPRWQNHLSYQDPLLKWQQQVVVVPLKFYQISKGRSLQCCVNYSRA